MSSTTDDVPIDPGESWQVADEVRLIAAMRRGVGAAFAEVFRRFAPLLIGMARRRDVPADDREAIVTEYLEDALMRLYGGSRAPTSLRPYLAAGFRKRLVTAWRDRVTNDARQRRLACAPSHGRERIVAEGLSEYAVYTAQGHQVSPHERDADPIRAARLELTRVLSDAMTDEERSLMGQIAERYPQREIAAALGVTPAAVRVRIHRLRERLARVAIAYIGTLPVEDGIALARFLATPRAQRVRPALSRHDGGRDREERP